MATTEHTINRLKLNPSEALIPLVGKRKARNEKYKKNRDTRIYVENPNRVKTMGEVEKLHYRRKKLGITNIFSTEENYHSNSLIILSIHKLAKSK